MSEETKPLIYEAISNAMNCIEAIGKNKENTAQRFRFRGIDEVYNSLHPIFAKNKIFTIPEVLEDRQEIRSTKNGGTLTYRILKIKYTCYASDGSHISGIVIGEAMDSGDKSSNKAMSVAHKYFLMQLFTIPTENAEDPDKDTYNPVESFDLNGWIGKIKACKIIDELKNIYDQAYSKVNTDENKDFIVPLRIAKDAQKEFLINQQTEIGE